MLNYKYKRQNDLNNTFVDHFDEHMLLKCYPPFSLQGLPQKQSQKINRPRINIGK